MTLPVHLLQLTNSPIIEIEIKFINKAKVFEKYQTYIYRHVLKVDITNHMRNLNWSWSQYLCHTLRTLTICMHEIIFRDLLSLYMIKQISFVVLWVTHFYIFPTNHSSILKINTVLLCVVSVQIVK